jgi:hypothetical protein
VKIEFPEGVVYCMQCVASTGNNFCLVFNQSNNSFLFSIFQDGSLVPTLFGLKVLVNPELGE